MGIRLIYGLKTEDNSYLKIFYPSKRFFCAAEKAAIDFNAFIYNKNESESKLLNKCKGHNIILRGTLPDSLYYFFQENQINIINDFPSTVLAKDKLSAAKFFNSIGVKHPKTELFTKANKNFSFPFILKPRYGKMGKGIFLVNNDKELKTIINNISSDQEYIIQEYIPEKAGSDIRFFFSSFSKEDRKNGLVPKKHPWIKNISSVSFVRQNNSAFTSNAHNGGSLITFKPTKDLQEEAEEIFALSGLYYGTVDFLFDKDNNFTVCEINSSPGFEALENTFGIDVALSILRVAQNI